MSSLLVKDPETGVVRMPEYRVPDLVLEGWIPETKEYDPLKAYKKNEQLQYRPACGPSGDVDPCSKRLPAFSTYCGKPPYSLLPELKPRAPWYQPTLKEPELFRTTTPDKAIGLPEEGAQKLKAFMNDRGINDLGDFEKYTRDLDCLEHAAEFARRHVPEKDQWMYKMLPEVLSEKADLEAAQILVDAGWQEAEKIFLKKSINEVTTPKLYSGDDLFLWKKFKRPVVVQDNGNLVLRGQMRSTKEEVTIRFIKIDEGHRLLPLTEKLQIEHLLREMAIQEYVHRHLGCAPKVMGLVAVRDEGDKFIRLGLVQKFINCIPGKSFHLTMLDAWKLHVKLSREGKSLMKESQWLRLIMRVVESAHAINHYLACIHFDFRMQNILLQYKDGELHPVINHWGLTVFQQAPITEIQMPSVMITISEWNTKYSYVPSEAFIIHRVDYRSDLFTIGDQISCMAEFFSHNLRLWRLADDMRRKFHIRIRYTHAIRKLREMVGAAWNREQEKPSLANKVRNFIREKRVLKKAISYTRTLESGESKVL